MAFDYNCSANTKHLVFMSYSWILSINYFKHTVLKLELVITNHFVMISEYVLQLIQGIRENNVNAYT